MTRNRATRRERGGRTPNLGVSAVRGAESKEGRSRALSVALRGCRQNWHVALLVALTVGNVVLAWRTL